MATNVGGESRERVTKVAVLAHARKTLEGGLPQLRETLLQRGIRDPIWFEVTKSKQAPKRVRAAIDAGANLFYVWGGDGMVQHVIDSVADHKVALAIIPAGTANLLATNLGIPHDLEGAVTLGTEGARRPLDVGVVNGHRFAVMAGAGFDALMIRDTNRVTKDRLGRVAYIWSGAKHLRDGSVKGRITVDGKKWFSGPLSCVLLGNVGSLFGGVTIFPNAEPDDGHLELGVVTASNPSQWVRALGAIATGHASNSRFVRITTAHKVDIRFDKRLPFELDGGDRPETKRLRVEVEPKAVTICVPKAQT